MKDFGKTIVAGGKTGTKAGAGITGTGIKGTIILLFLFLLLSCPLSCSLPGGVSTYTSSLSGCNSDNAVASAITPPVSISSPVITITPCQNAGLKILNNSGNTPEERFGTPAEYKRMPLASGSFGEYLRELPLKPHGTKVYYYDGRLKSPDVHEAVIDMDTGPRDLQQCADAVIRLRAEYLYARGEYDRISFNFTNGFRADYRTWLNGSRIRVEGNEAFWVQQGKRLEGYDYFREYLDMVFAYAGTLSLSQEMLNIPLSQMQPGDIFLKGPYPGHCVIVIDMAEDPLTGRKKFMLAQSYMPAQDIHILKNPANEQGDPWYDLDFGVQLETPQWNFTTDQLYRFRE